MEDTIYFADSFPSQWIDADYQLMTREVQSLDKIVYGVVRAKSIANKIFPTIKIPQGMKQHIVATEVEQEPPKFDDNFMREDMDQVRKSETTFYPVFMHKDFQLYMTDIDASRNNKYYNTDLRALTLRGSVGTITDYKERVIWRGYDIAGRGIATANEQGSIDSHSKGIMNTSSILDMSAGAGGDSDITASGDGSASVAQGMKVLIAKFYYGPYDLIMSPLVYAQLALNQNATTEIHDIERMQSMIDLNGNKILRGMKATPYLLNAAETTSTGVIVMVDRKTPAGEPTIVLGDEYPIRHIPTSQNALGVKGKVIWAGIPCVLRTNAIAHDSAITTT